MNRNKMFSEKLPLFSIIVPIYNVGKFLPQCIESILGQTYTDFELILVDDGSTDSSGKICDEYAAKDKRIIVIHKENERQGVARKVACEKAQGEYIIPVDGDDWIDKQLLEYLNHIIHKYQPEIIYYGEIRAIDEEHFLSFSNFSLQPGYYDRNKLIQDIFPDLIRNIQGKYLVPGVCEKAFKRTLFVPYQTSIDPRIVIGEDAAVTYACIAHANSMFVSSKQLYYYRVNPMSTLRKKTQGYPWANPYWVHEYLLKYLNIDDVLEPQLYRRGCHELFNVVISHLQTNRPYQEVKKEILEQLSLPENRSFIQNAHFKFGCKDWGARLALKYKLILLMKLYSLYEMKFIKK